MKLLKEKRQYPRLRKFWAPMTLHLSHIARYAPSIQSHIHLKSFAQILTIVMKHPLNNSLAINDCLIREKFVNLCLLIITDTCHDRE